MKNLLGWLKWMVILVMLLTSQGFSQSLPTQPIAGGANLEIWATPITFLSQITAIKSQPKTLFLSEGVYSIPANLIIQANIMLKPERGAIIEVPSGKILTINGGFDAGLSQTFFCSGTGKVVFGAGSVKEVYPQWWGAKGDDSADDYTALQAAFSSGHKVFLPPGSYRYSTQLVPVTHQVISGAGMNLTILKFIGSGGYGIYASQNQYLALSDFTLDGSLSSNSSGIFADNVSWPSDNWVISRVIVQNFSNYQVRTDTLWAPIWRDCLLIGRADHSSDHIYYEENVNAWGATFDGCWFRRIAPGKFGLKSSANNIKAVRTAFGCDNASFGGGVSISGGGIFDTCDFENLGENQPAISLESGWTSLVTQNNICWGGKIPSGPQSGPYPFIKVNHAGSGVSCIDCKNDILFAGGSHQNGWWVIPLVDCNNNAGYTISVQGLMPVAPDGSRPPLWGGILNKPDTVPVNMPIRCSGIPSWGTYLKGYILWETVPAPGSAPAHVCTESGSQGTLKGVTGSITTGKNLLTANSVGRLHVGDYIQVAGAGDNGSNLDTIVAGIDLPAKVLTLADAAGTTVSGAAVSFRAAVFKDWGALAQ